MVTKSEEVRAKIFSHIVENHKAVFEENFKELLVGKEREISRLRKENSSFGKRINALESRIEAMENGKVFRFIQTMRKIFGGR